MDPSKMQGAPENTMKICQFWRREMYIRILIPKICWRTLCQLDIFVGIHWKNSPSAIWFPFSTRHGRDWRLEGWPLHGVTGALSILGNAVGGSLSLADPRLGLVGRWMQMDPSMHIMCTSIKIYIYMYISIFISYPHEYIHLHFCRLCSCSNPVFLPSRIQDRG